VGLTQKIKKIAEQGGDDEAARHGDDGGRDGSRSHAAYGTLARLQ
jgi:hypothetical protein